MDLLDIQRRLRLLVDNRNYFFKDTTRLDAERYLYSKTDFSGLSETEIGNVETILGKSFPNDFKQYLSVFGKKCSELFDCGQDIVPDKFVDYQNWAAELLQEQNIKSFLPDTSVVFFFHQGYSFYFFDKQGDYTFVYLYVEGDSEPRKMYDSFADFLETELKRLEKINEDSQKADGFFITIHNGFQQTEYPAKNTGIKPRQVGDQFKI